MTIQELRKLGYNKVADAAEKNWKHPEEEDLIDGFIWRGTTGGYNFWRHVWRKEFDEAFKICPHLKED